MAADDARPAFSADYPFLSFPFWPRLAASQMPRVLAVCTGNLSFNELCQLPLKCTLERGRGREAAASSCPVDDNLTCVLFPTIILLFLISALQKEEAPHLQGEKEEGRGEGGKKISTEDSVQLFQKLNRFLNGVINTTYELF